MRRTMSVLAAVAAVSVAAPVSAGVYADDLGKCLVAKSTDADRLHLVQWFYSALSAHPAISSLSTITPMQRDGFNETMADLVQRLLLQDCRQEAKSALGNEGAGVLESSFALLGQVATQRLFGEPAVQAQINAYAGKIDEEKIRELAKEAGVPIAGAPAPK